MHYFYEKEVIAASQRLALPTLADFLARPLLGKLNRFVLGLPILCDGNHACLREARFAQKSQESGKNTLFCVVKVVSLKKNQGNLAHTPPTITATSLRDGHDKQKSHLKIEN